jgi:predicted DNA-binding protein (MmcQ/YjbR family)
MKGAVAKYITDTFGTVETTTNFGYTFFFFGSDHRLPFATLASSDNDHDRVSKLDRPGVFRLNIGVSKKTFQSLFRMDAIDPANYDFTILDRIMPHPHYAAQHFVCVLNPGEATLTRVREMLGEAYELAVRRKKKKPSGGEAPVA